MTRRVLAILAAMILVAAGIAAFALLGQSRSSAPPQGSGEKLFPDLVTRANDIAKIEIVSGADTIVLQKQGDAWVLPAKGNYPAQRSRISDLVSSIAALTLLEPKTSDPLRYDQLGLADPGKETGAGKEVRLLDAQNKPIAAAVFGRSAPSLGRSGGGIYVRRVGEAQTWLAEGLFNIPDTIMAWAAPLTFGPGDAKAIRTVTIEDGAGKPMVSFTRAKAEDEIYTARPVLAGKLDMDKIGRLAAIPGSLSFDDVHATLDHDAGSPVRRIIFEGFDGSKYELTVLNAGKGAWVDARQQAPAAKSFTAVHDGFIYKLPEYRVSLLQSNAKDFLEPPAQDKPGVAHPVKVHP